MKIIACIFFLLTSSVHISAQWVQTSGPSGGGVSDFAVANGKILAATFDLGNGVYASTDSGTSWHESGLQNLMLTHITAFNSTVITATTHNSYNETDDIYRSGDGGDSWVRVFSVQNINGIRSICHFQGRWYFSAQGQNGGLFISTDDGLNWTKTTPANFNFTHPIPLIASDNSLIAGTDDAGIPTIFKSVDGQTWTPAMNVDTVVHKQIYCGAASGSTIWLGVTGGIILSADGNTWKFLVNAKLDQPSTEYISSLVVSGNHLLAISSLNNIYYSWDGASFQWNKAFGNGVPANASYFFSVYLWNSIYFLGSSTGVMQSHNDGANWQYSAAGLRAASVLQLGASGGKIFAVTERGVSVSSDVGITWRDPQTLKDLNDVPISGFVNGHSRFYAYGSGIYTWSGFMWTGIDTTIITSLTEGASERLFAARQSNDAIGGTGGIFFSDNVGAKWDSMLVFTNTIDTEFYFLPQCVTAHGSTIVAVQKAIAFLTFGNSYFIYRSTDNGSSWQKSQVFNSPSFINFADGSFYMGTYDGGLFQSPDDGITWTPIGFNSKSGVTSFVKSGAALFATVVGNGNIADGIYFQENSAGWKYANGGVPNITGPLATDGTFLYSGGPSVWKRRLNELGVNEGKKISQDLSLELYPNPTAEILHMHIITSDPINATLFVTDEKGSMVFSQELYGSGADAALSVADFAEGTYVAKLVNKSGFVIASGRFVVMRK